MMSQPSAWRCSFALSFKGRAFQTRGKRADLSNDDDIRNRARVPFPTDRIRVFLGIRRYGVTMNSMREIA